MEIRHDKVTITDFEGKPYVTKEFVVYGDAKAEEKGGYDLFILKAIF